MRSDTRIWGRSVQFRSCRCIAWFHLPMFPKANKGDRERVLCIVVYACIIRMSSRLMFGPAEGRKISPSPIMKFDTSAKVQASWQWDIEAFPSQLLSRFELRTGNSSYCNFLPCVVLLDLGSGCESFGARDYCKSPQSPLEIRCCSSSFLNNVSQTNYFS